jgi:hypothetical protein
MIIVRRALKTQARQFKPGTGFGEKDLDKICPGRAASQQIGGVWNA